MGDGTKENPYTREDVLRLIHENGDTANSLDLSGMFFEEGIDLSKLGLRDIILKEAFLKNAHFEGSDLCGSHLEGAYLEFAHFEGAELHFAHLERALLWSAEFSLDTRLENVDWGSYILWEEMAKTYSAAAITYRRLKQWHTNAGYHDIAAKFYYREMEAKRKALKWRSKHWNDLLALEILRVLFGYGERWRRVLISIAVLILLFALTYCVIGSVWEWSAFRNSLYFSAVSFTALGYGSWVHETNGWIKGIGAFESLVGISMMALLLVTFFRKWTR